MSKKLATIVLLSIALTACGVVIPTQGPAAATVTVQATAAPTTAAPTAQSPATATATPTETATPKVCTVINDYQLQDLPELSVENGGYLHVEWFLPSQPEYETVLPSGRYLIKTPLAGHVWEYSPDCDPNQVLRQVADHIARRLALKANNGGFVPYQRLLETNDLHLLETVVMTGDPNVPLALP